MLPNTYIRFETDLDSHRMQEGMKIFLTHTVGFRGEQGRLLIWSIKTKSALRRKWLGCYSGHRAWLAGEFSLWLELLTSVQREDTLAFLFTLPDIGQKRKERDSNAEQ